MIYFYYFETNDEIKKGDHVEIKRILKKPLKGQVTFVYNPEKPSIPKGDNPIGYSIRLDNDKELFINGVDKNITLVKRGVVVTRQNKESDKTDE